MDFSWPNLHTKFPLHHFYHTERKMNKDDFHIPFIKSLTIVAIVTVFAMVSSRYLVDYYISHSKYSQKTTEFSSHNSQFGTVYGKE